MRRSDAAAYAEGCTTEEPPPNQKAEIYKAVGTFVSDVPTDTSAWSEWGLASRRQGKVTDFFWGGRLQTSSEGCTSFQDC